MKQSRRQRSVDELIAETRKRHSRCRAEEKDSIMALVGASESASEAEN